MDVYKDFAYLYYAGPYVYSENMAKFLPRILKKFKTEPQTLLDVACGDGRFAVMMAQQGMVVTGVDASKKMLHYAKERARKADVKIDFVCQEMQHLSMTRKYDLVTCWFDSLNYLLTKGELFKTFRNISTCLNRDGLFIFDMNTIYGLAIRWRERSPGIEVDTNTIFEAHHGYEYNPRKKIATLKITGFVKRGKLWRRIVEVHRERGYTLNEIREGLKKAGLRELTCWGNIRRMTRPTKKSGRFWFVSKKKVPTS